MDTESFFNKLWLQYTKITPQAKRIYSAFESDGQHIVNDHIAFRTFDIPPFNIESLEPFILKLGYSFYESYNFPEKHLKARAYLHYEGSFPRIFLSELLVGELTEGHQKLIQETLKKSEQVFNSFDIFIAGRPWPIVNWSDYLALSSESEYAAWVLVMGFCANHFTISVNALTPDCMDYVLKVIKKLNIDMNAAGGVIKGGEHTRLEQCSTLADCIPVQFKGGDIHDIPSCYYEFAKRYPDQNGDLFQGFVPASANYIFHSTHLDHR